MKGVWALLAVACVARGAMAQDPFDPCTKSARNPLDIYEAGKCGEKRAKQQAPVPEFSRPFPAPVRNTDTGANSGLSDQGPRQAAREYYFEIAVENPGTYQAMEYLLHVYDEVPLLGDDTISRERSTWMRSAAAYRIGDMYALGKAADKSPSEAG